MNDDDKHIDALIETLIYSLFVIAMLVGVVLLAALSVIAYTWLRTLGLGL